MPPLPSRAQVSVLRTLSEGFVLASDLKGEAWSYVDPGEGPDATWRRLSTNVPPRTARGLLRRGWIEVRGASR